MKIYCCGIGGIGLSAYASLQRHAGHEVSGSDRAESPLLDDLRLRQGIAVTLDQSGAAVPEDADLFVYSEAIPATSPERKRASELGIRQLSYPQAVGELSRGYSVIAVCGTHGKSSTTAMAARVMIEAGMDPTVIVGTKIQELQGRNWRAGKSEWFLLEACEYRHAFHSYSPRIILLTTCDGDHFDFYKTVEEYRNAFVTFAQKLPADGVLITHCGDPDCQFVAEESGLSAEARSAKAEKTVIDADGFPLITLGTPGEHMQRNAQLVLALADVLQIDGSQAQQIVGGYRGSWRRMEQRGVTAGGAVVIDDYGHHPREIRETLRALRGAYSGMRMIVVFQPHTHDRTLKLYEDFTSCFSDADFLIVTDVYDARSDIETAQVDIAKFIDDIARGSGAEVIHGGTLQQAEDLLRAKGLSSNDLLVCMGAGDITMLAERMIGE